MIPPNQRAIHHTKNYDPLLDQLWSSQHDQHWDSYNHANLKRTRFFQGDEQTLFDNDTENFLNYI